jgi:hypothetical protein
MDVDTEETAIIVMTVIGCVFVCVSVRTQVDDGCVRRWAVGCLCLQIP